MNINEHRQRLVQTIGNDDSAVSSKIDENSLKSIKVELITSIYRCMHKNVHMCYPL